MGDLSKYHPSVANVLKWFKSDHLPEHLAIVVDKLAVLAFEMADTLEPSAELTTGIRKLLEAKDCFARATLETHDMIAQATAGDSQTVQAQPAQVGGESK